MAAPTLYYFPAAGRGELSRTIAAAGGIELIEGGVPGADLDKADFGSPSGVPLLHHGDLKMSQSTAIENYLSFLAFPDLAPQQRAKDSQFCSIKEDVAAGTYKVLFDPEMKEDKTKAATELKKNCDKWFPIIEKQCPPAGYINGEAYPTAADVAVMNICDAEMSFGISNKKAGINWGAYPKMRALATRTAQHPPLKAYVAKSATFKADPMGFSAALTKQIVLVSTSASNLGGHPTGLWLEELAAPYYKFKAAGFDVVISSTQGGAVPIDAASIAGDFFTAEAKQFMHDGPAMGALLHSVPLSSIDFSAANIKAIFMCGGHGVEIDFVDNASMKAAIETMYASERIVAAVCHGPVCLAQCNKPNGEPLLKGLTATGFSNSEESAVGLTDKCKWLIEDKFKELGASYEAGGDWSVNVKDSGNLLTGQNPQSSSALADAVLAKLS